MKRYLFTLLLFTISVITSSAQIKVACIGNSITYGSTLKNPATESYPSQLQRMLGDKYVLQNFGELGATLLYKGHSPYILREGFKKALAFNPDIAVIHLGINDTDPRDWPNYGDDFVKDYLSIIDSLRNRNKNIRIIIARMTPILSGHPRFNSGTKQWFVKIQSQIELVAKLAKVELIDFNRPLVLHPELYNDVVHPNMQGASVMADVVYKGITGNYGGLSMPILYSDNMVIQRGKPITITGMANANEIVTISFNGLRLSTKTKTDGKWNVVFPSITSPKTNLELKVSTKDRKLMFKNVSVGEVWLCSGQSNMWFRLKNAENSHSDIQNSTDPDLRFFNMKPVNTSDIQFSDAIIDSVNNLLPFSKAQWTSCTAETAQDFSAIAYYFGKMLRDSLKMPVGLILNAVGGSTQESWIDIETLENEYPLILNDWINNDFTQDWCRFRAKTNMNNTPIKHIHHPYEPAYLFESGIRPLLQSEIKGVIWYQGESNEHCYETFEDLFRLFVKSWRKEWGNNTLPVYYVQLSSLNRPEWPWVRDMQRRMMDSISYTGMAVCSDIGDKNDVHPIYKKQVGERLARWALHDQYGVNNLIVSGPLVKDAKYEKGKAVITFDYSKGLKSSDNKPLRTFEVAKYDGLFYPAKAQVINDQIVLSSDEVDTINIVRYGWTPYTDANLVNSDGLPASTFRININ